MASSNTPTFGSNSTRELIVCRVCGRTLLMGERSFGYFTNRGEGPYDVCDLCTTKASKFGLQSEQVSSEQVSKLGPQRSLLQRFRKRHALPRPQPSELTRDFEAGDAAASGPTSFSSASEKSRTSDKKRMLGGRKRREPEVGMRAVGSHPLGVDAVGYAAIPTALVAFNSSSHRRTLAGLYKTLGAPNASVLPRSATDREVIITVAWDIVWYQYRVMIDAIEVSRGAYLEELADRWQDWNATVDGDGSVRELRDTNDEIGNTPEDVD